MGKYVRQEVTPSAWQDLGVITVADTAWAAAEFATKVVENLASTIVLLGDIPYGAPNVELRFFQLFTSIIPFTNHIHARSKFNFSLESSVDGSKVFSKNALVARGNTSLPAQSI